MQANYHFLPDNEWDPWVGLDTGWRGYWVKHATGTDSRHGLDIARLQAGVDYRVSPEFALSPYVGAGLTTFLTQELAAEQSFSNVRSPDVNIYVAEHAGTVRPVRIERSIRSPGDRELTAMGGAGRSIRPALCVQAESPIPLLRRNRRQRS